MDHGRIIKVSVLAAAVLAGPLLTGCQTDNQHDEWKAQANNRWLDLRSGMMLEMAHQQFATGDLELCEKTVRDAMQLDPANARLHVLAARIGIERGQLERAYRLLEAAAQHDAKLPTAFYYQGLVLQRWQRFDEAYERYGQAYHLERDNPDYLLAMSEMLVQTGRPGEAVELLESRLNYFDQNAALRTTLGHLHMMQDEPEQAAMFFHQASMLSPDNQKIQADMALAQLAAGQHEKAAATLERLLTRPEMKGRSDLRRTLARAYMKLGRVDDARAVYLKLARGEGGAAQDWVKLGELAWQQGDLSGALHAASRVNQLEPNNHRGYLLAGMVWHKRERLDEALRMFDRAAELAPGSATPLILRGLALQRAGRNAAAAEAYREALQRQPDDARAKKLLDSLASGA